MDGLILIIQMIIEAIGNCPKAKAMSDAELASAVKTMDRRDVVRLYFALGRNGTRGQERRGCMRFVTAEAQLYDADDAEALVAEARALA